MRWWIGAIVTAAAAALVLGGGRSLVLRPSRPTGSPVLPVRAPTAEEEGQEIARAPVPAVRPLAEPGAQPQRQREESLSRRQSSPRQTAPIRATKPEPEPGSSGRVSPDQQGVPPAGAAQGSAGPVPSAGVPLRQGPHVDGPEPEAESVEMLPPSPRGPESAPSQSRGPVLSPPVLLTATTHYPGDAYSVTVDRSLLTPELRLVVPEGRVVLRVLVRPDGTVERVEVVESSGHPVLDRAAADAARSWKFQPATRDGEPIAAWAIIPVRFVVP